MNSEAARITIDLWRTTYIVPSSHRAPDLLRRGLDELVAAQVPQACALWVSTVIDPDDESIWLVRELDLDFAMDVGRGAVERAPDVWGKQLAVRLGRLMTEGALDDNVMYFPNRAAYLAHFARDVANGRAWDKWWYGEFDGLRVLSLGRTIREALRDGAADVLVCLAGAGGLQDVLGVLSPEDARAIYQVCREEVEQAATAAAMRKWTGVLLELWRDKPLRSEEENLYRDGLWMLALAGAHHAGAMPDGDFMTSLDGLLNLRRVLRPIRSADIFDRLIRTLAASDLGGATALAITAGSENSYAALQFFSEMMQGDADWGAQAAGVLLNEDFRRESTASEPLRDQTILSRFGGIFSLGPSLVTLGFEATGADAAALRHLIAVKCLGGERARETASDPAVRLFSGFTGAFSEALEALENSSALVELKHLLLGRYRGTSLVAEPVILPGGEAVLFRDVDENDWIWATAGGTEVPRGLKTTPRSDFKPAQPHVSYFSLGVCWPGIPFSLELIGTIAARAVLRHFARRLIGFSASRPDHLYTNFLAGRTTIEDTGYRLEVEIMPPPLSVVLRMAGIHNEVYHAPWIGREVWLRQTSE